MAENHFDFKDEAQRLRNITLKVEDAESKSLSGFGGRRLPENSAGLGNSSSRSYREENTRLSPALSNQSKNYFASSGISSDQLGVPRPKYDTTLSKKRTE